MTIPSPFLSIDSSCDRALQTIRTNLSQAGLWVVQTFNLNTARLSLHDCYCPNHGTEACDCQMIILLVYGEVAEPVTLVLHSYNGRTWISIANSLFQSRDEKLADRVREVLKSLVIVGT
jgi:hypothetical protein